MSTEAQIRVNRRNAQKSTGPACQKVLEIRSITLSLCALVPLWLELNQSKITNYAKQSQFAGYSNERKSCLHKGL